MVSYNFFGHFVNYTVLIFQFTSGFCLINQSYSKNMSMLFKSMIATSIHFLYPLIMTSIDVYYVISPFLVPSTLKT